MRGVGRRLSLLTPLAVLAALSGPGDAGAHVRTGRVAVDYRANVSPARPPLADAGVVRVYEGDLAIGLTVKPRHEITVLGYAGEPLLRIGAAGVEVNESSLTAAGMGLLPRTPKVDQPAPRWRLGSSARSFLWHDARVRGLPRDVARKRWTLPLVVDGRPASVEGEIWRVDAPAFWPWLLVGGALPALAALLLATRRNALLRPAAVGLGVLAAAATIWLETGFALASTATAVSWVESANVLVFTLAGLAFVVFGSGDARPVAGGALGLVGVFVGLTKLPVLLHGVVLSALPDLGVRVAVVLAISAGAAAAAVAVPVFFEAVEGGDESLRLDRGL
jgi:hypothetical protein